MTWDPETSRRGIPLTAIALGVVAGVSAYGVVTLLNRRIGRPPDSAPQRAHRGLKRFGGYTVAGRTVTIAKPRAEVYAFWRDFSRLPGFMRNLERVETDSEGRQVWTVKGPAGHPILLRTEIVEDREGEHISWASTPDSEVETRGRVSFRDAPAGRGTLVEAIIAYKPPAGEAGRWIAKLFAAEPEIQARRDLKRFKMLMETGEIATSANRRAPA